MKTNHYHTREAYERLYFNLLKERAIPANKNIGHLSDFHLLCAINRELCEQNCIQLTPDELELELY